MSELTEDERLEAQWAADRVTRQREIAVDRLFEQVGNDFEGLVMLMPTEAPKPPCCLRKELEGS